MFKNLIAIAREIRASKFRSRQEQARSRKVYDNPYDALFQGSNMVRVNLADCSDKLGFRYGVWQPWVETARQIIEKQPARLDFPSSVFGRFYREWSFPLLDDVFGCSIRDERMKNHFLKLFHGNFMPFCEGFSSDLSSQIEAATRYLESENLRVGGQQLSPADSIKQDGTWTDEKGEIEILRMEKLIHSISKHGYRSSPKPDGDILVYALAKEGTFRYVVVSGLHRTSVLSALENKTITVRLYRNIVVAPETVNYWPLVMQGIYSPEAALAYFNHIFDFDSISWAQKHLIPERQTSHDD